MNLVPSEHRGQDVSPSPYGACSYGGKMLSQPGVTSVGRQNGLFRSMFPSLLNFHRSVLILLLAGLGVEA